MKLVNESNVYNLPGHLLLRRELRRQEEQQGDGALLLRGGRAEEGQSQRRGAVTEVSWPSNPR